MLVRLERPNPTEAHRLFVGHLDGQVSSSRPVTRANGKLLKWTRQPEVSFVKLLDDQHCVHHSRRMASVWGRQSRPLTKCSTLIDAGYRIVFVCNLRILHLRRIKPAGVLLNVL